MKLARLGVLGFLQEFGDGAADFGAPFEDGGGGVGEMRHVLRNLRGDGEEGVDEAEFLGGEGGGLFVPQTLENHAVFVVLDAVSEHLSADGVHGRLEVREVVGAVDGGERRVEESSVAISPGRALSRLDEVISCGPAHGVEVWVLGRLGVEVAAVPIDG